MGDRPGKSFQLLNVLKMKLCVTKADKKKLVLDLRRIHIITIGHNQYLLLILNTAKISSKQQNFQQNVACSCFQVCGSFLGAKSCILQKCKLQRAHLENCLIQCNIFSKKYLRTFLKILDFENFENLPRCLASAALKSCRATVNCW